jgi:hypothetical protein
MPSKERSMASPVRVFNLNQMLLVPVEDIKELKEKIEKVRELIREYGPAGQPRTLAKADEVIGAIETELAGIEFPEE